MVPNSNIGRMGNRMHKGVCLFLFASAWLVDGLSVAAASAASSEIPPKLEAFLSYPFVSDLTAADSGDTIAWVETRKGVRNIWIAAAPAFHPRRLTATTADDGQELAGLNFSPDGKTLVWSRGVGEHNSWASALPPPNPASSVEEPHTEIWASSSSGTPIKLAEDGEEPLVSSTGRLAYLKDSQVWTVDLTGTGKPARLFYDRGKIYGLAWSPDGSKLAFVSGRSDHSFIGIYSGADHPLSWLSPATAIDSAPVWSPDGQRIAFARQPGIADPLASVLVEKPNPFSIWVGSVADGTAAPIWQSPVTLNGSFPQVPDGLFLMWGAGNRLTFRAEMDGWPHLYSVSSTGGEAKLLTPGDFMVEHVSMTPDRKALLYSANSGTVAGDVDRRHVFRVAIDRASPTPLTPGSGLEWTPVPVGDKAIAFVSSTATTPTHVVMAKADGHDPHALETPGNDYTANGLITPKSVSFKAPDGLLIHGQLFLPPGGKAKHPALIFVHGGPARQMLLGWSYLDYYTHAYVMNQYLASRGFVVLSVNYRLGIGYGRAFQHPAQGSIAGNSEYQDVVAGAGFLRDLPEVDAGRIGIWGGSHGGLLTAHALAHNSDIFKAGVDFYGVHDWTLYPGMVERPQRYEQSEYNAVLKSAFESSPEAAIAGWTSPVLLIHGDDDRNVRFDQTVDLARRLSAQGTPFEELILPNETHGFLRYDSWLRTDTATVHFLEAKLKPRRRTE
jgi:dipeptidyl aminopeptidase/acylaminoacyl peptidase